MTVQVISFSSDPGSLSSRKVPHVFTSWVLVCLTIISVMNTSQAQTFQYSRGWTNGKRSGPATSGSANNFGFVDLENGYLNPEVSDFGLIPGHIQVLNPQAKLRSLDYNQHLYRKLGAGSTGGNLNTRKQPVWFGTILGVDSSDSSGSSQNIVGTGSSPNPSGGTSNDF